MSDKAYLAMCEQLGMEPNKELLTPDITELDSMSQTALAIFNLLNDTFIPGTMPLYNGKDITGIPVMFEMFGITGEMERFRMLEYLRILDSGAKRAAVDAFNKATKSKKGRGVPPPTAANNPKK